MKLIFNTLLITGAHGMLGKHLVEKFQEYGLPSDSVILCPSRNELDLRNEEQVENFMYRHKPDIVIHLAARVRGLQGNLNQPTLSLIENEKIATVILDACFRYIPRKVFFAGTAASYGYPYINLPLKEEHFLHGDVHSSEFGYAWAKRSAFSRLKLLNQVHGVETTYGIFTNLYGPFDRFEGNETHVIPALISRSIKNCRDNSSNLQVWGNPNTTRDFMHAQDAARAIIHLLESEEESFRLVNISTAVETSISQVGEILREKFRFNEITWSQDKPIGIPKRCLDNSSLLNSGFKMKFNLFDGLTNTIEWLEKNPQEGRR